MGGTKEYRCGEDNPKWIHDIGTHLSGSRRIALIVFLRQTALTQEECVKRLRSPDGARAAQTRPLWAALHPFHRLFGLY